MIAHVDADSFFASVLLRLYPHLRGKPLLAVGMGGNCVIAATYEAKNKGVKTGMRLSEARLLVPGAIEMPSDFRETGIASEQIEAILKDICPIIEQMSIDEWFLNLTSIVGGVPPDPRAWGLETQKNVLQMTDLSVSIGVAPSKLLAKMAGEYRKPAGVTVLRDADIKAFLKDRPAAAIPGIGRQRQLKTDALGWATAWDIAAAKDADLIRVCGRPGVEMKRELLGYSIDPVCEDVRPPKSISRCRTFRPMKDPTMLRAHLLKHAEYCVMKMRRWNLACREISIHVRDAEYRYFGGHRRLDRPGTTTTDVIPIALALMTDLVMRGPKWPASRSEATGNDRSARLRPPQADYGGQPPLREGWNQVSLALHSLETGGTTQASLFEDQGAVLAEERLQAAMDNLHERYGRNSLTRAAALPVRTGTTKELNYPIVG